MAAVRRGRRSRRGELAECQVVVVHIAQMDADFVGEGIRQFQRGCGKRTPTRSRDMDPDYLEHLRREKQAELPWGH